MTEYRIDDLARVSGVTTRNIRGYQERGLLPKPLRRGRIAIYTEKHLHNLRAINKLLRNGFTLNHIATFLLDPRARIGDALDLNGILDEPWSKSESELVSRAELEERVGSVDDEVLATLLRGGVLALVDDPDAFRVVHPSILANFAELAAEGVELSVIASTYERFAGKMREAADILMTTAQEEVDRRRGPGWVPKSDADVAWAVRLIGTMRRTATENAHSALDAALDASLDLQLMAHQAAVEDVAGAAD